MKNKIDKNDMKNKVKKKNVDVCFSCMWLAV